MIEPARLAELVAAATGILDEETETRLMALAFPKAARTRVAA